MSRSTTLLTLLTVAVAAAPGRAEPAAPLSALAKMPVKEVTVFKDGHAFVLHEGKMATDADGNVLLDRLPTPVLGTFWPYSADKNAKLAMVTAARRRVLVERTALTLRELVEANEGAEVLVTETNDKSYRATLVGSPTRGTQELEATSGPVTGELLPQKGNLLLLKTVEGTKAVAFEQVRDVKFLGNYKTKLAHEEFRNLLTLKLTWDGGKAARQADVGMAYLQKGFRWIPNYHVDLDGKGKAVVKLQATLLNELADLDDATVHLVVGVPTFRFKDTIDPLALGQTLAQLSPFFHEGGPSRTQALAGNFSNSIMSQVAGNPSMPEPAPGGGLGPDVDLGKNEDLYLYTLKNVTLKRGQRQVLTVAQHTLEYKDVYVLDLPFSPPQEVRRHARAEQVELARLMQAPKVTHKVRLLNKTSQPLTTAPALLVKNGRVLAQGMTTYTAAGSSSDLTLTTAVDVKIRRTEREVKRTPNALVHENDQFWRIDLAGTVELTSYRREAIEVEVTRHVLGHVSEASDNGKAEMINALEDDTYLEPVEHPAWWGYYNWPGWWHRVNGIGRVTWKVKLEPGKSAPLNYKWHYYWR